MSDKQCMYVLQKAKPGPVTREECCKEIAVEQEPSTGRWYCREHFNQRRTNNVAGSNGDGLTFSFQS
jgi:hypothetical protein